MLLEYRYIPSCGSQNVKNRTVELSSEGDRCFVQSVVAQKAEAQLVKHDVQKQKLSSTQTRSTSLCCENSREGQA